MSKKKLTLSVVENLRALADSVEVLVNSMQEDEASATSETSMPSKAEPIALEKVRAVLAEKSQNGKQPEVKALITKFGANKLTDVDPSCYEQLLQEAEVL